MQRNISPLLVDPASSYKRYIDSRQISSFLNKKLVVEAQVINKQYSPVFNCLKRISDKKPQTKKVTAGRGQSKIVQVESLGTIQSARLSLGNIYSAYSSPRNSRITIKSSVISQSQRLTNTKRSQSATCRLGLLKQQRKGDLPDKLFSSLSVFFGQAHQNTKKSTPEVLIPKSKLKIQGFSPTMNYSMEATV